MIFLFKILLAFQIKTVSGSSLTGEIKKANSEEVFFVDEFYKYLDKISHQRDVESLEAIRKLIAIAIVKRTELYIEKEKEKRVIQR